jgi:hypothetical protein
MKQTTRTIPFKPWLPDAELELFFGKGKIVEIRRTGRVSEVEVYSDKPVDVLTDLLRERAENYHLTLLRREDKQKAGLYARMEKQLSKNAPCEPITRTENGRIEHGFRYLHDDGTWQQVWIQA